MTHFGDFSIFTKHSFKILIVEDNIADARLIEEYLSEYMIIHANFQYELHLASSLSEGINMAENNKYDIVLLDLSLPDSLGMDTLTAFHDRVKDIPIIILSGFDRADMEIAAVQLGAQDYLLKGYIDGNLLVRAMSYAIERHNLITELKALSLTDELTSLSNRRGFTTVAKQQLKTAIRNNERMLLLYLDLDNMKTINDKLGHSYGDAALIETAFILNNTFRDSDIKARMGGDEFAVLATVGDGNSSILINRLISNMENINKKPNRDFFLAFSIGVAEFNPESPCSLEELIDIADDRMYAQKKMKKGDKIRRAA